MGSMKSRWQGKHREATVGGTGPTYSKAFFSFWPSQGATSPLRIWALEPLPWEVPSHPFPQVMGLPHTSVILWRSAGHCGTVVKSLGSADRRPGVESQWPAAAWQVTYLLCTSCVSEDNDSTYILGLFEGLKKKTLQKPFLSTAPSNNHIVLGGLCSC